ncbi:MAG TPA: ABC transporter ATP-binding protein [Acidimicrobiales bacterium]|nr:ABC transporter ATP-binding protein [Acidimicrobiales bacterium]
MHPWRPAGRKLLGDELERARVNPATVKRAWGFARPYRRQLILYLATIVGSAAIAVGPAWVFKRLIDDAIPGRKLAEVNVLFVIAVGLALGETGMRLLNRYFGARIGEGLIFDMRVALYDHVQRMPIAFFTRTQTGNLLSRMSNDVVGAQATITTLATVISDVFLLTFVLVSMLSLSWQVTLATLMILPLIVVIDRRLSPRMVGLSRVRMQLNGEMGATMQERFNVSGALLVKLFGRRHDDVDAFSARAGDVRDSGIQLAMTSRLYYASLTLMGALGTAAVYWLGGRAVVSGSLKLGSLVALAALVSRLYSPLTDLSSARVDLLTALVSFERCFEVLDAPLAIADKPDAVELVNPRGRLEFEDVWFRYPAPSTVSIASLEGEDVELSDEPSGWILRGVSFRTDPGQITALVGPTGAGKTTLSSLVPRLYDVTSGALRIDGKDVRDVTLASLTSSIGVVTQDPHLFHDTIAANLRYARPAATDADIVAACEAARIHHTIAALPEGYDTIVGERGYRMSGGEKQRLAIARVLLKNPAIVILDEATAHLDSETEALVQQALADALIGRASLVIAHRLSTIKAADEILVLDRGRISERGTHADLLARRGLYAELYETQYATAPHESGDEAVS